ncbi:MAG: hypothetical protein DWQ01_08910 [Planctomycetota bacterium]|nr:MAG: hypothetical protein DWQ01_08910 [Planctomycetota bacterium]
MNILGISAFYHDSAAALLQDGALVAAAQEERFSRKKHDHRFPRHAIRHCLEAAGLQASDLDQVVFYDKPLLKFERMLESFLATAPASFALFRKGIPLWLKQKLHLPREMDRGLDGGYSNAYWFLEHHESHAASAFFPSPFEEAAILTLDGVGEWATGSLGIGRGHRIELLQELRFPHSLGLLYSALTYFCGFKVNSGEYKLMGLAPYGKPRFQQAILSQLLDLKQDGSFRLNLDYFAFHRREVMTSRKMERLFEGPPRKPESQIGSREMDLAASIQAVTEEIMLRMAHHAHQKTGMKHLCLAGGVALNCVGNGRLLRESPFEKIWIQPAAGDAGGALGAALFAWHQLLDKPRTIIKPDGMQGALLGPSFGPEAVRSFLQQQEAEFEELAEPKLIAAMNQALQKGEVIGHMAGPLEFGPRALGNRSILGDPRNPKMQRQMNLKIKFRESFRPFAPIVLRERAAKYFQLPEDVESPYMLLVAQVNPSQMVAETETAEGFDRLQQLRSKIPAVTHVDGSARVQTVDPERHPRMHRLLSAFESSTGCPVLVNTSFNVRGEPIVCTPEDAFRCFMATDMDVLVIENFLLYKNKQKKARADLRQEHLQQFELD